MDCPGLEVLFNGASDMFFAMVASAAAPTTTIDALVRNSRLLRAWVTSLDLPAMLVLLLCVVVVFVVVGWCYYYCVYVVVKFGANSVGLLLTKPRSPLYTTR